MPISNIASGITDRSQAERSEHRGAHGVAYGRTRTFGDIRVRMVGYAAGHVADHGCGTGHLRLCLMGELHTVPKDGRSFVLRPGVSDQVADGAAPHRS